MSMLVVSRKTVREAVAIKLTTYAAGAFEAIYEYQASTFDKMSPVVAVVSAGQRVMTDMTIGGVYLNIHTFVRYEKAADGWTEKNSEDLIDDLANLIGSFIQVYSNRVDEEDPEWVTMEQIDRSEVDAFTVGGTEYRHEVWPLYLLAHNPS